MIVLEPRIPVSAATFRRQIQDQPKRIEVWGAPRIDLQEHQARLSAAGAGNLSRYPS